MEGVQPEQPADNAGAVIRQLQPALHVLLTQKRNDARQHLMQALENLNNFEEVIAQAIVLSQELEQCKESLRIAESALAERNAEVLRLQGGPQRGFADPGQLQEVINKIEAVGRENGELLTENRILTERVQSLEQELNYQQNFNHEIASLKVELPHILQSQAEESANLAAERLQISLKDQLQETARLVTVKVMDIIPLAAHLEVESGWMNSETAENLYELAYLSISNTLNSADMRVVARVNLLLAKLFGPCEEMSEFSRGILAFIRKNSEKGVNLLKNIEVVCVRASGEAGLKDAITGVIKLVGTRECDDCMHISARLSKILSPPTLCKVIDAVAKYFSQRDQALPMWTEALSQVPLDWIDSQQAEKCLEHIMMAVIMSNFSEDCLALVKLMQTYRVVNETALLAFAMQARLLLSSESLSRQLREYILEIINQVEFSREMELAEGENHCKLVSASMKLLYEHSAVEEIAKLPLFLRELSPRSKRRSQFSHFAQLLTRFESEEKLRRFGLGALAWLFPSANARENVLFASSFFQKLADSGDFEETAATVGQLLQALSKAELPHIVEDALGEMLAFGSSLKQAAQVCLFFCSAEGLMRTWKVLLEESRNKREVIDAAAALVEVGLHESLFAALQVFRMLEPLGLPIALNLVTEAISVLRDFASGPLTELLRTAVKVLSAPDQPSALAAKCLIAWRDGRRSAHIYTFCMHVLERLKTAGTEEMLDSVVDIFSQESGILEVVSTLLEIYVLDDSEPRILSRQLAALRGQQDAEVLSPLLIKLRNQPMQPRHRTLFISSALDLCDAGDLHLISRGMETLIDIPETPHFLEVLSQLRAKGVAKDFLTAAQRNQSALTVTMQLASVFVELEAQGIREMSVPANVSNALLHRPAEMSELLPSVMALIHTRRDGIGPICVKIIEELSERGQNAAMLLSAICEITKNLIESAQPNAVVALCSVLLGARREAEEAIALSLYKHFPLIKDKLIALLNRVQDQVTLRDVGLMVEHTHMKEIVNVQSTLIRFFDFRNGKWGQETQLEKEIPCDSQNSSYTILDDGSIFCCGGIIHAGLSGPRRTGATLSVAYILSRNGRVTDFPRMNSARRNHGIIFIESTRTIYVFGGSNF